MTAPAIGVSSAWAPVPRRLFVLVLFLFGPLVYLAPLSAVTLLLLLFVLTGLIAVDSNYLPLHPRSAILQVWLELGGIGAVLGFGLVIVMLMRAYGAPAWRDPASQAAFGAATLAGLSVALVSFGIWQEWFEAALFVAAAVAFYTARTRV